MFQWKRNLLVASLVVLLAGTAFTAGFMANDYLERRGIWSAVNGRQPNLALFTEAWRWVERSYIGERPPMTLVTYGAIRGALTTLNDPYTIFVEPAARQEERESLRGNFGGIGANLQRNEQGEVILSPIPGNPAETAGLVDGDVLLAVDGRPITAEMTVEEIAQLIRGEKGTTVHLTIRHPNATTPVEVTIERADILIPSVSYRLLETEPAAGYVQLTRFSGESAGEVQQAITNLLGQGAQTLILDLRHNGGGLLDAAIDISDLFLTAGPILYQQSRDEGEQEYAADAYTIADGLPLVVLIDEATASSSEIVAGALRDHERATLIGRTTFGKGSVQLVYDLSDGSSIHVTSARWLTPDGYQIDQQGLPPDIEVIPSQEAIDNGRDEVLDRAIEFLQNGS
ncbi:MAG: S41 family peptidase [Chloroflexota bacterium]